MGGGEKFILDPDHDAPEQVATEFHRRFPGRVVVVGETAYLRKESYMWTNNQDSIRDWIRCTVRGMKVISEYDMDYPCSDHDAWKSYSAVIGMAKRMDGDFVEKLNPVGYLAFKNGVYAFESGVRIKREPHCLIDDAGDMEATIDLRCTQEFMPWPVKGLNFTTRVERQFPDTRPKQESMDNAMNKILCAILPEKTMRDYTMHCLSRALAGR
jgi:hypothetical protein